MSLKHGWRWMVALAAIVAIACGGEKGTATPTELQRVKAGTLDIVLLSSDEAVQQGKDAVVLEFRGADGALKDVGIVRAVATMPMAGMAPMFGVVDVRQTDTPGRYAVATDLGMAGGWQISLEWEGPSGRGTARFQQTVR
ncbi:MAG: FixH family protein [Vicinamibacterales bacterium]